MRWLIPCAVVVVACGPRPMHDPDAGSGVDAGTDAGADAGTDAGVPYEVPVVRQDHSLFWNDPLLLDDATLLSFAKLMAAAANDGHGGALVSQWFHRFATTPHSERAHPAQFVDDFAVAHGADPTQWDLSLMPFKVTGVHNRIDLAKYGVGGHCGELRASVSSTDVSLQPFHALFLFRQPAGSGDVAPDGRVHCTATARRWADLSRLEGAALRDAVRERIREGFVHARFELAETVEFTLAPWEWRQWVKQPDADGGFTLENPPLFQQVDVEGLNADGGRRDAFLTWVEGNAAALDARTLLLPDTYRAQSVRVTQGIPRVPISLAGLNAAVAAQYPTLRQNLELVGCAACHTADADFVQTRTDRTVSPFYDKELKARERHLEKIARGETPYAPFGPLQVGPVLPP